MKISTALLLALLGATLFAQAWPAAAEPFLRTEDRPRCSHYTATRQPLFGQLHLHTQYSADAATVSTRNTPREAYRFAKGEPVGLAPFYDTRLVRTPEDPLPSGGVSGHPYCLPPDRCQFTASRIIEIPPGRELDFVAVTDHSEFLGETNICYFEGGLPCDAIGPDPCEGGTFCNAPPGQAAGTCVPWGYNDPFCLAARGAVDRLSNGIGAALFVGVWQQWNPADPPYPFCLQSTPNGENTCAIQAQNVWQSTIAAAEEAYDRTSACKFTSFVGYEYTSMPTLQQCSRSFQPCLANEDCKGGAQDLCLPPGQCGEPQGKQCFVGGESVCAAGSACIANGGGNNLHRNIIFRNSSVPPAPLSYVVQPTGCGAGRDCAQYRGPSGQAAPGTYSTSAGVSLGSPSVMLRALAGQCNLQKNGCQFLSIPHNSNMSGGAMFLTPETADDAGTRAEYEKLVEIFQIKGDSECRYSPAHPLDWQPGAASPDEICAFEDMNYATLAGGILVDPDARQIPPRSYVRNALKEGLKYQAQSPRGINPFKLGFVGSLDNHNGTPTSTEVDYSKFGGHGTISFGAGGQMQNESNFLGLETNGGGLTVAWAEENSRDSIFAAMERRETYATSGTRPIVRFFGGFGLPATICKQGDFAAQGYAGGQPMGGTLTSAQAPAGRAPTFAVSALMDPGWEGHPGASLQRIQIVKGWVDAAGEVREKVVDVIGSPVQAAVDLDTCTPAPAGIGSARAQLCATWSDPDFNPSLHAFYYARVLENPSCRWNQYYCNDRGVDCSQPPRLGADQVGYNAYEYQQCCREDVPKVVQQRAWTSPIWYEP